MCSQIFARGAAALQRSLAWRATAPTALVFCVPNAATVIVDVVVTRCATVGILCIVTYVLCAIDAECVDDADDTTGEASARSSPNTPRNVVIVNRLVVVVIAVVVVVDDVCSWHVPPVYASSDYTNASTPQPSVDQWRHRPHRRRDDAPKNANRELSQLCDAMTRANDVLVGEWTIEALPRVLDVIAHTRLGRDVDELVRQRLVAGVRAGCASGALPMDVIALICQTCCAMVTRRRGRGHRGDKGGEVSDDADDESDEDEDGNADAGTRDGTRAWIDVLEMVSETTAKTRASAGRATRRAGRLNATFASSLIDAYMNKPSTGAICTALVLLTSIVGAGDESTSSRVVQAVIHVANAATEADISNFIDASEDEDVRCLVSVLVSSKDPLTVASINLLRVITSFRREVYASVIGGLLQQMPSRTNAIEALEQIMQREQLTTEEKSKISEHIQNAVRCIPELSHTMGKVASSRVLRILAPLATMNAVNELIEKDEISSVVSGLGLVKEMLKCGLNVSQGMQALHRVLISADEHTPVQQTVFEIIASSLQDGVSIDASVLEKAESKAIERSTESLNMIRSLLTDGQWSYGLDESICCSVASALNLICALSTEQASTPNARVIREGVETICVLRETLKKTMEQQNGAFEVEIDNDSVADDAENCPSVLLPLAPLRLMVETVLDAILSHSEQFKHILDDIQLGLAGSCSWESWIITLLLDTHLKLSQLQPKQDCVSVLSVSGCSSLLVLAVEFGDTEWSLEQRFHVMNLCGEVLKTHFSSEDERCTLLLDSCASQCLDTLHEHWFAFNNGKLRSDVLSVKGTMMSLQTLQSVCWVAISRSTKASLEKSPALESIQSLISNALNDKVLERGVKSVVAFAKPHLKRNSVINAGRASTKSPISSMVALLISSLHHQVQQTYSLDEPLESWDSVISECLVLLDILLPMTAFELNENELVENAVLMLENVVIQFRELPAQVICEITRSVLKFHEQRSSLPDCLKTASRMLKIAMRYTLDTLPSFPQQLITLMIAVNDIVLRLTKQGNGVDLYSMRDAFVSLTSVLVKISSILMRDVYEKQSVCDGVANFLTLVNSAMYQSIEAASELCLAQNTAANIDGQRIDAALVLAGARLHHSTAKMIELFPLTELQKLELQRCEFMTVCAGVFTNLRALQLTLAHDAPLDCSLVAIANALALDDITKYSENLRRLGESVQTVTGSRATAGSVPNSNASSRENSSSKPRKRVRNPYLDAVIAQEGGRQDEYDDMADFIVCKPGRNYRDVLGLT